MASNFTREVAERGVSLKIVDMARRVSSSVITFDQRKFIIAGKVRSCYLISARRFCCFLCKGRGHLLAFSLLIWYMMLCFVFFQVV
jgi:hypothetical protein